MINGYVSCKGNQLIDGSLKPIRLTGVNWFGFETSDFNPLGLDRRNYKDLLKQIKQMGFNCVRLPFCGSILQDSTVPLKIGYQPNADLQYKSSIQVMDNIIDGCQEIGLKVILCYFSFKPLVSVEGDQGWDHTHGIYEDPLWYDSDCSEDQWIQNWVGLAARYAGNPTVIGFDLKNEPHDKAEWGTSSANDWCRASAKCGDAIHAANADLLILVQGIDRDTWWGGDLTGVRTHPVLLKNKNKLVYSFHEYGPEVFNQPWFSDANFPHSLILRWKQEFDFIYDSNTAPLLCGEFGIRDSNSFNKKSGLWFSFFMSFMGGRYSWTFWSLNPNSDDTGGILEDDWITPVQWKLDALKSYLHSQ
jgi:endoglucanase